MKQIDRKPYKSIYDVCRLQNEVFATDRYAITILKVYSYLTTMIDNHYFTCISFRSIAKELGLSRSTVRDIVTWLIQSQDIVRSDTEICQYKLS